MTAALSVGAFALAACGAGSDGSGASGAEALAVEVPPAVVVADAVTLDPASDVATNLLPDLVVDNLNDDNKVNLRNYGTGDKPILIWMWAPH
jgi:hypothetical protein